MGGSHKATRRARAQSREATRRGCRRASTVLAALALLPLGWSSAAAYAPGDDVGDTGDIGVERPIERAVDRAAKPRSRAQHRVQEPDPSPGREDGQATSDAADAAETDDERDLAMASTWHLDPVLLTPLPTDSHTTTEAREQLAGIASRFERVLERYETALADAKAAEADAREAARTLERARAALRDAAAVYRADRRLFVDVIVEAYTTDSVGDFGKILSAETSEDLVNGMATLQQMGKSQSSAVVEADLSRDRLRGAAAVVAAAERASRASVDRANAAVTRATTARAEVVADLRNARRLVEESALGDQLALARGYDVRALGDVTFPLPPSASYVDQQNWGGKSSHWASVHTGDDLSTACGTPVLAATDGTVEVRTDQSWSGNWLVMVSTGEGELSTWYAHLQALHVEDGQEVEAGETIGLVGALGNATGCHLHFEVHSDGGGIYEDNVDPVSWLREVDAYPAA